MRGYRGWRIAWAAGWLAILSGCVVAPGPAYVGGPVPGAVIVPGPPPPLPAVVAPPAPAVGMVWVPGTWIWRGRWIWGRGHWAYPPHPYTRWVPGHWWHRDGRWFWGRGHWMRR